MDEYEGLSLLSSPSSTTRLARIFRIALRLNGAFEQLQVSPIVHSTSIEDEDFQALVTESRVYLQIPIEGLTHSVQLQTIATAMIETRNDLEYDFQVTLYSPTYNLPSEFMKYEAFFKRDEMSYRMSIRFIRRP